jgi:dipeptidyl aminopeptidase/acylaminoacyl peptidase
MLIFHGTADTESAPYADCVRFVEEMRSAGNTVDFHPIPDKGHFLWRYGAYWQEARGAQMAFWKQLGYLDGRQR